MHKPTHRFITIIIALASSGYAGSYLYENRDFNKPIHLCEASLLNELRSPSTYMVVSRNRTDIPITKDQFIKHYKMTKSGITDMELFSKVSIYNNGKTDKDADWNGYIDSLTGTRIFSPSEIIVRIQYDANNAFNAPVRGEKYCSFLTSYDGQEITDMNMITEELRD